VLSRPRRRSRRPQRQRRSGRADLLAPFDGICTAPDVDTLEATFGDALGDFYSLYELAGHPPSSATSRARTTWPNCGGIQWHQTALRTNVLCGVPGSLVGDGVSSSKGDSHGRAVVCCGAD
jgi:hypothetical protein